ncbi:MAG: hypothetical protein IM551_03460 [Chitinophagaceae bacterium]|nr:hypothetical protein [Chitinophagaceae bacterium]
MEKLIKMTSFTILWHEGTNEFENTTFTKWTEAQKAFDKIFKRHAKGGRQGYTKVKVKVQWEDGSEIVDRLDVGDKDYNPNIERLGEYLFKAVNFYTVMYSSDLISRHDLSFSDNDWNDGTWPTETIEPEDRAENSPKQPQKSPKPAGLPGSPKISLKSPKNGRKIAPKQAEISPNQATTQPAPKQAEKQPEKPYFLRLSFAEIIEMQADTYLLN